MGTIVEQGVSVVIRKATEYLVDPLSIDTRIPRLSWIIDAGTARGVSQSAYQIEVAGTPAGWWMGLLEKADWSAQWIGDPLPSVDNVIAAVFTVQSGRYSFVAR